MSANVVYQQDSQPAEMSAETLSLDVDSLGTASSATVLFSPSSSRKESIVTVVRQKLRSFATSMVPVGPDGPDEKPLSPREVEPSTSSLPAKPKEEGLPRPPFSCVPVYAVIIAVIFLIILMGGVNAVLELKPQFIYGRRNETEWTNSTLVL